MPVIKKSIIPIFIIGFLLLTGGCGNPTVENAKRMLNSKAKAENSPYRFRSWNLEGGSATMQKYVLPEILAVPMRQDISVAQGVLRQDLLRGLKATETNLVGISQYKQKKNLHIEIWFIKRYNDIERFYIRMRSTLDGGTDYLIDGPLKETLIPDEQNDKK